VVCAVGLPPEDFDVLRRRSRVCATPFTVARNGAGARQRPDPPRPVSFRPHHPHCVTAAGRARALLRDEAMSQTGGPHGRASTMRRGSGVIRPQVVIDESWFPLRGASSRRPGRRVVTPADPCGSRTLWLRICFVRAFIRPLWPWVPATSSARSSPRTVPPRFAVTEPVVARSCEPGRPTALDRPCSPCGRPRRRPGRGHASDHRRWTRALCTGHATCPRRGPKPMPSRCIERPGACLGPSSAFGLALGVVLRQA
jgi:hypothetical protein